MQPTFLGLEGLALTPDETALFRAADPAGYILFKRNIDTPDQVRALTASLTDLAGRALPILIDQEGGRVARLRPPHWPEYPAGDVFAQLYDKAPVTAMEAARLNALSLAALLRDLGITVDCLPLLDVRDPGGHDIIGDRAYGADPMQVAALGRMTLDGLAQGGVCGVVKHIPGHGRAAADSHLELPVVTASRAELERDFRPFRTLNWAPMAMTAHVTYTALDPDRCATLSPIVIDLIRTDIGFQNLLMSDDIGMKALGAPSAGGYPAGSNALADFGARALACLDAGCDIALHCSGDFAEMRSVCEAVPEIGAAARARLDAAMASIASGDATPAAQWADARDRLLALA
ncbi:glycoside hydrolase family 3 N-terminal domain-containing protein [Polymorphobacter fuscus]|uniref:beta-N-acetylhexosaminidase n=1 Tax=Sandarakinorhabdus fusca TaxID=1439888 RepID=A0A7C9GPM6_9SPHN|nr:glycoside hydrolase family 3 N-terminal domain-containing protein [Polymorphobacter fuscus]KAB7646414.1 glycoside hydrolase family 3 protein [Polymorphobacter fuscus]MQT17652.1 beta-hexosaminidase [Polymorphobacter fuscus]NJC09803.1 beta-N-acetylhexosaminidase [Polymorphobacter fuscus]